MIAYHQVRVGSQKTIQKVRVNVSFMVFLLESIRHRKLIRNGYSNHPTEHPWYFPRTSHMIIDKRYFLSASAYNSSISNQHL